MAPPHSNLRTDLSDYWQQAQRHYVNLVAGALMALLAFISSITGLVIPAWAFWILAIGFLVIAQFRTYRDVRRDLNQLRNTVDQQGARRHRLLESREINNETFYVSELVKPNQKPLVENRSFTDCTINGPGMVAFVANDELAHCSLGEGDMDSILHEMPNPGVKQGIIGFVNCKLSRCKLRGIGIYGDRAFLDKVRRTTTVL